DRDAAWPVRAMGELMRTRLTALHVPARLGGHGQGLTALAAVVETLARGCASTAMCYGMHCVATAVIATRSTASQDRRYLEPIAAGEHLTTLALSESGTGAHFYLSETELAREGEVYALRGEKQFVTNGGHADSYVVSTRASVPSEHGDFSCVIVDAGVPGIDWGAPWRGFGMRGNDSRAMRLDARVPAGNLLGNEGDEVWYVFEVVAPYFLVAMAAVYVGIAQSALTAATQHLLERRHSGSGDALARQPTLQHRLGEMWTAVERSRQLLRHAAHLGDLGGTTALPAILACKMDAAETAVGVAGDAMTLAGGMGYRDNGLFARLLRDARAGHVMSPTTEMLKLWIGRVTLGLPLV
ncbi:MAG TPA: acyl-CoA dehydrogenase family protein, partial [Myxococcota bacterium]|nr:acyl-CoA dehydrogenase family protein [Myxococcota bacterium]